MHSFEIKREIAKCILGIIERHYTHLNWENALLMLTVYVLDLNDPLIAKRAVNCLVLEAKRNCDSWLIDSLLSDQDSIELLKSNKLYSTVLNALQEILCSKADRCAKTNQYPRIRKESYCLCCHSYILDRDTIYSFPKSSNSDYVYGLINTSLKQEEISKREFLLSNMLRQLYDKYGMNKFFLNLWEYLESKHIHTELCQIEQDSELSFLLLSNNINQAVRILGICSPCHDSLTSDLMLTLIKQKRYDLAYYIGAKSSTSERRLFYTFWNILSLEYPSEGDLSFLVKTCRSVKV